MEGFVEVGGYRGLELGRGLGGYSGDVSVMMEWKMSARRRRKGRRLRAEFGGRVCARGR